MLDQNEKLERLAILQVENVRNYFLDPKPSKKRKNNKIEKEKNLKSLNRKLSEDELKVDSKLDDLQKRISVFTKAETAAVEKRIAEANEKYRVKKEIEKELRKCRLEERLWVIKKAQKEKEEGNRMTAKGFIWDGAMYVKKGD